MHASFCAPLWLSLSLPALAQTYDVSTLAPPGGPVANTGRAIDVDGTRAIFGSSNGAWIAERQATGRWEVVADLVAPGVLTTAQYGQAVAIDGDRAVVGAPVDSSPGFTTGSICIFERDPAGLWAFSAQLFLPSAVALPLFGGAVDVDGDRIAVGASFERSPFGNQNSGVVHVFDRDAGGNWVLDATLGSPSATNGYRLGFSVALDGERLIAGAPNFGAPGHAFVFERTFFGWQEVADLMGSGAGSTGEFGAAVELSGPTAVVGGPGDDSVTSNSGAAWAYRRLVSGTWVEEQKLLPSNALLGGSAGQALQLSDNRLLMGVPLADGAGVVNAGMADLFEREGSGVWTLAHTLIPSAPTVDQRAGYGVGLGDGWVLLGAPGPLDSSAAADDLVDVLYTYAASDATPPETYGKGTTACGSLLDLSTSLPPLVGSSALTLITEGAPANGLGLGFIGLEQEGIGADPLGLDVLLHVPLTSIPPFLYLPGLSNADGVGFVPAPISTNPALAGATFYAQTVWIDPQCGVGPLGLTSSVGLTITIGG